jgi:hypothetical protein
MNRQQEQILQMTSDLQALTQQLQDLSNAYKSLVPLLLRLNNFEWAGRAGAGAEPGAGIADVNHVNNLLSFPWLLSPFAAVASCGLKIGRFSKIC